MDDAISFAEDDIAFHVKFERSVFGDGETVLCVVGLLGAADPDDHAISLHIDRAGELDGAGGDREAVDEEADAAVEGGDRLVVGEVLNQLTVQGCAAAAGDADMGLAGVGCGLRGDGGLGWELSDGLASGGRGGLELRELDVARKRGAAGESLAVQRWFDAGLAFDCGDVEFGRRGGEEAAEPVFVFKMVGGSGDRPRR